MTKMDGSSVPLDFQSLITTILKAQRSAGSPQPSTPDTLPCQLTPHLQLESLFEMPKPSADEFDVEMFIESYQIV